MRRNLAMGKSSYTPATDLKAAKAAAKPTTAADLEKPIQRWYMRGGTPVRRSAETIARLQERRNVKIARELADKNPK